MPRPRRVRDPPCPCPHSWAFLEVATNASYNDSLQAYAAGLAEAAVTEQVRRTPPDVRAVVAARAGPAGDTAVSPS